MPDAPPIADAPADRDVPWSQVWHLPVLGLGLLMFAAGLYLAFDPDEPEHNFPEKLNDVAMYLKADNLDEARAGLNTVAAHYELLDSDSKARFYQYNGDLIYAQNLDQADALTPVVRENYLQAISKYEQSRGYGRSLDPASTRRFAASLVAVGRQQQALDLVDTMTDAPAARRYQIVRDLIERSRASGRDDPAETLDLIDRFEVELAGETDAATRLAQQAWAVDTHAALMLDAGDASGAVDLLIKKIPVLQSAAGGADLDDALARLRLRLAEAYHAEGDLDAADRNYRFAREQFEPTDVANARALVGLGNIALAQPSRSSIPEANTLFTQVIRDFVSETRPAIDALVGRADAQARLGAHREALADLALAVERLNELPAPLPDLVARATDVSAAHARLAQDRGEHEMALDYLRTGLPLFTGDPPPDTLLDLAVTHESIAQSKAAYADAIDPKQARPPADGDPEDDAPRSPRAAELARRDAAIHFAAAADRYYQHANAMTIADDQAHGLSMWKAAQTYGSAADWPKAIEVYSLFVKTRQNDPLRLRAVHNLAKAYMADSQDQPAMELLLHLIRDHPHTPEAYDSLVPLARAYARNGQQDEALRALRTVVTDHDAITPESEPYRLALIELGRLFHRVMDADPNYAEPAIERLTEAVERYGDGPEGPQLRFLLADSYRKSVDNLDTQLAQTLGNASQAEVLQERRRRLERAQVYFNESINQYESLAPESLGPLDELYLRNAYFYQADCAFENQRFDQAVRLYDLAARRFEQHPASLIALVQKVNAYCEMGQFQQARVANENALWHLNRIPDEAFDDPSLPMTREHWENWLRWSSELDAFADAADRTGGVRSN
ncbi:MAG: tetratricopeptide repeat protein [Planctomycetota bacterium]